MIAAPAPPITPEHFRVREPRLRLWTRDEYYRAAEMGLFGPEERLELLRGEIIVMSPQLAPHAMGVYRTGVVLQPIVTEAGLILRHQMPVSLSDNTEPEPDVTVVGGRAEDYDEHHPRPQDILLLVEVSLSTLRFDRNRKARIYAEEGISDYWVLSIRDRQLEVRRNPANGTYPPPVVYGEADMVTPLFAPDARILVADLLPREPVTNG